MICVLGLKGGSGKTLTSVNLAVSLAEAGHSVAILDLDLQFGDVALAMGLTPMRTIYDLVRSGGSLDAGKLEDFLMEHPSGARALLAPVRPDQAAMITVPVPLRGPAPARRDVRVRRHRHAAELRARGDQLASTPPPTCWSWRCATRCR